MKKQYPNIILIILDATRQDHISYYGYNKKTTPNIDKFARDSLTYQNAFTVSPWTLPSFASIFTGMYPSEHGVDRSNPFLDGTYTTVAEHFEALGYETLCVTNNSWLNEHSRFSRGFDHFLKVWQFFQVNEDPLGRRGLQKDKFTTKDAVRDIKHGNVFKNLVNAFYGRFFYKRWDYGARKVNLLFKKWYRNRPVKKPFFACLHYLEPHLEYRPKSEFVKKFLPTGVSYSQAMKINQDAWSYICEKNEMRTRDFKTLNALYDAEISYMDYKIGELFEFLKDEDIYEKSLIIITADHGENIGEHCLMDHQYCLYDTLLKIPLIIKFPDREYTGKINKIVQSIDIFPSLIHYIDGKTIKQSNGESFLPNNIDGRKNNDAYAEYLEPQPSIETMTKRYRCSEIKKYDKKLRSIRTENYKLILSSKGERELYNIKEDPSEETNVASKKTAIVTQLEELINAKFGGFNDTKTKTKKELDENIKKRLESLGYL